MAAESWLNDWDPEFSDEQMQIICGIDEAAEQVSTDFDFMLFLGIDLDIEEWEIDNFDHMTRVGEVYEFPAPQSYSFEKDTAEGFAHNDGDCVRPVVFRIEPGRIRAVDRFKHQAAAEWAEGEYIIPADTKFEVVDQRIEYDDDGAFEVRRIKLRAL